MNDRQDVWPSRQKAFATRIVEHRKRSTQAFMETRATSVKQHDDLFSKAALMAPLPTSCVTSSLIAVWSFVST